MSPLSQSPSSVEMQTFLKTVHQDEDDDDDYQEPEQRFYTRPRHSIRLTRNIPSFIKILINSFSTNNLPTDVPKRNSRTMFPGPYSSMASLMMRTSRTSSNIVQRRRHFDNPRQKHMVKQIVDAWSSMSDPQSPHSYSSVGAPGSLGHRV